jgi:hypothetical protein
MPRTTSVEHIQDNYNSNSWADIIKPRHALKLVDVQKWIVLRETSNISTMSMKQPTTYIGITAQQMLF